MIKKEMLKAIMDDQTQKENFYSIQRDIETEEEIDYEAFCFGTIAGQVLSQIFKLKITSEEKKEKAITLFEEIKKDIMQLGITDEASILLGIEIMMVSDILNTQEGEEFLKKIKEEKNTEITKKPQVKKDLKQYSTFESTMMGKINQLISEKYFNQFESGDVELLDVAMIVIASEIESGIKKGDQARLKEIFDLTGEFLETQFQIELSQIGTVIASLVNDKAKEQILEFAGGKFTVKLAQKKESNTQKVTRSLDRLLKLQNS